MEVSGVNTNTARFNIDKKVYYSFLETPLDSVQISPQNSEQKDKSQDNGMKEVADLLNPKKNYKRLVTTIAGIAGASVLILGLTVAALFRGKSGMSEKMGNFLQKQRGKIYSLQAESSAWADIRLKIRTKLVAFFDKGLTTWVNAEQFRNRLIDQKIIKKIGILNRPTEWVITKFKNAAIKTSKARYQKCVEKARKFQELLPGLKEIAPEKAALIEESINEIVKKTENLLNNFDKRQKEIDDILEKIAKEYDRQHELLSKGKSGIIETVKSIFQDTKSIATSGDNITSRKNLEELKAKKAELYRLKEEISRNVKDNYERNIELLKHVENHIIEASKNNKTLEKKYIHYFSDHIRNLENIMKSYKDAETKVGENYRIRHIKTFISGSQEFLKSIEENGYNSDGKLDPVITYLKEAINRITDDKDLILNKYKTNNIKDEKGLVEKLRMHLKIYDEKTGRNTAKAKNEHLYNQFKKATDELSKSLNSAVEFESDNLAFRKMDLKLGGGNFEVLGLSIPIGLGAYSVAKANSSDERVSKGIRTGSVIGGGLIGWVTSGVVMCLSAGTAILVGVGAGLVGDQIGKYVDNRFWSKGRDWDAVKKQKQQEATIKA